MIWFNSPTFTGHGGVAAATGAEDNTIRHVVAENNSSPDQPQRMSQNGTKEDDDSCEPLPMNDYDDAHENLMEMEEFTVLDNARHSNHGEEGMNENEDMYFDSMVNNVLEQSHDATMEQDKDLIFQNESTPMGFKQQEKQQQPVLSHSHPIDRARQGMLDALSMLPSEQRQAYDMAVSLRPDVVELEAPFQRYLVTCEYNYWAAAEKMADYFTLRRKTFGDDKFALPLRIATNPDEETALSPEDVELIQCGGNNFTPPNEQNGCPVVVVDRQLLLNTPSMCEARVRARTTFYFLHTMQESELVMANGYVGVIISEADSSNGVPANYQRSMEDFRIILSSCWGMTCRGVHLVAAKTTLATMTATLAMYLANIFHFDFFREQLKMHFVSSGEEARTELQKYGFSWQHLPPRLGGSANFAIWLRNRLELEKQRYSCGSSPGAVRNNNKSPVITQMAPSAMSQAESTRSGSPTRKIVSACSATRAPLDEQNHLLEMDFETNDISSQAETRETSKHAEDYQKVLSYVENIFSMASSILEEGSGPPATSSSEATTSSSAMVAQEVLEKLLIFKGRNTTTGQFQFQKTKAVELLEDPIIKQEIHSLEQALPLLTEQILRGSPSPKLKMTAELNDCNQSESTTSPDSDYDCDEEEMDQTLELLQNDINCLQQANTELREEGAYLEGAQAYASKAVETFEQYKSKHMDSLAKEVSATIVALLKKKDISLSYANGGNDGLWQEMADRILSKLLWWWGQEAPPPLTADLLTLALHPSDMAQ